MPGSIQDLGAGRFRIRWDFYDSNGKRHQRQRDIAGTRKDADRELTSIKNDLHQGAYIDRSRMTVEEQVTEWFNFHQFEIEVKTRARYEENIRLHIIPCVGSIRLSEFNVKHIQDFYKSKLSGGRRDGREGGLSTGTLRKIHSILKLAIDDAVTKERIRENPVRKVKPPRGARPGEEIRPLNEEQTRTFLRKAREDIYYNYFTVLLGTGLRPEEALALERPYIDFKNYAITICKVVVCVKGRMVPKSIPKTSKSRRTILFGELVAEALKDQLAAQEALKQELGPALYHDKGLVFATSTGNYVNSSNIRSRHFKPILKAAGLPDIRVYDLRHTHATLFFRSCRDIKRVSERLGHEDVAFTAKTYYHLLPDQDDEEIAKFDGVLTGMAPVFAPLPAGASGDTCVRNCVRGNVIPFPTSVPTKKKTRNCLRDTRI